MVSIAAKIGRTPQSLNVWVKAAHIDGGRKPGVTKDAAAKLKTLERENRELRQGYEILRKASAYFATLSANEDIRPSCKGTECDGPFKRGVQSLSMKYTQRLAEAGGEPSVGSVGGPMAMLRQRLSTASTRQRIPIELALGETLRKPKNATMPS
jgi:hypothetical protein